ncbi:universal stress protein [Actinomadura logoneensis]|uniref:Universal stress protein n=1 Tax=Actinomadura logoneensis TaxID=2293572 RepID=A0A372JR16_9ACTN|nr:universal stress protein [Actinomadura logoneensis]RFU42389.1 universal stress protein [Actinomadura logoneensis]
MFELATDGPKVVVCGVDGSAPSLHAAAYAWGLARRSGARLVLVYAMPVAAMSTLTPGGAAVLREAAEEVAEEMRAELRKAAEREPVSHEFRTEPGDPAAVLSKIADETRADAVVVGASAQAGHRLVGSVAVRLVRAGRWPVTVVP